MANSKGQRLQFDLDDEDLKLFCEEAEEQLELLDSSLVQLEGEPDAELVAADLPGRAHPQGFERNHRAPEDGDRSPTRWRRCSMRCARGGARRRHAVVDALLAGLDALRVLAQRGRDTRSIPASKPPGSKSELHAVLAGDSDAEAEVAAAPASGALSPSAADAARGRPRCGRHRVPRPRGDCRQLPVAIDPLASRCCRRWRRLGGSWNAGLNAKLSKAAAANSA